MPLSHTPAWRPPKSASIPAFSINWPAKGFGSRLQQWNKGTFQTYSCCCGWNYCMSKMPTLEQSPWSPRSSLGRSAFRAKGYGTIYVPVFRRPIRVNAQRVTPIKVWVTAKGAAAIPPRKATPTSLSASSYFAPARPWRCLFHRRRSAGLMLGFGEDQPNADPLGRSAADARYWG